VLVVVYAVIFRPRYSTIRAPSGVTYDVIEITRDEGIASLLGLQAQAAEPALFVNYYSREGGAGEARELVDYVVPMADSAGLGLIVVAQTTPAVARWLPFVRWKMWAWRRFGPGDWRIPEPGAGLPSNKRLKLSARVDYGMNLSLARRSLSAIR